MSPRDPSDRRRAVLALSLLGLGVVILLVALVWVVGMEVPRMAAFVADVFSPGLGLRTAAIIAAVVSFLAVIVLAIVSGDGLLGEIQFVIPGFFLFFLFFWLMTAWVF